MLDQIVRLLKKGLAYILKHRIKSSLALILLVWYYFSLPKKLFQSPYATVVESANGELLGAIIAEDSQWRFPASDSLPDKFVTCITTFEDQYFDYHFGFNPISMGNALVENMQAKKIVRGGSTITQQVIRLSRNLQKRTYFEKAIELILATRLEFRHSKAEILNLYAAHAPFGGNIVGLEMASWRYFGASPFQLSWAEHATLAVLPNAPSLIFPGKNQQLLLEKRNRLLKKLYENKKIDQITYELSIEESLPEKMFSMPRIAPHFTQFVAKSNRGKKIQSSIDYGLQIRLNQIAASYYQQIKSNEVYNLAILVLDVETQKVLGYVGNAPTDEIHDKDVDIVQAKRSTGSILKPFLYASMLDDGELLPKELIADVPTQISGYVPQNFNLKYDGAVPASDALSRSLNIPAVLMLQKFGVENFKNYLRKMQFKSINKPANHYGLSLILGGAESSLWEICQGYSGLTATLNHFIETSGYYENQWGKLSYLKNGSPDFGKETFFKTTIGAGAIATTYNALREVSRPEGDEAWRYYDSAIPIAWKTGTSFGNRDAWAVGTNKKYVVGIWVGNANGEGRPNLTGVRSAAPILFDVFQLLPKVNWFQKPIEDLIEIDICQTSGLLPNENCPKTKQWIPTKGATAGICPYHQIIHLDTNEEFRVHSNCESVENMVSKSWFTLPPVMEWFYKKSHTTYQSLPPLRMDCDGVFPEKMDFIYPKKETKIYLTKHFDGNFQPVIFKVAHTKPSYKLFWYANETFLGSTQNFHELPVMIESGKYKITVVDEKGYEISTQIELVKE
uniref:penicillin-binding protein 1C n=1 Tax=Flavobacterium sp. TaxID=239 RepID=UPI00404A5BE7